VCVYVKVYYWRLLQTAFTLPQLNPKNINQNSSWLFISQFSLFTSFSSVGLWVWLAHLNLSKCYYAYKSKSTLFFRFISITLSIILSLRWGKYTSQYNSSLVISTCNYIKAKIYICYTSYTRVNCITTSQQTIHFSFNTFSCLSKNHSSPFLCFLSVKLCPFPSVVLKEKFHFRVFIHTVSSSPPRQRRKIEILLKETCLDCGKVSLHISGVPILP